MVKAGENKFNTKPMYQIELIWNRSFNFVSFGNPHKTLEEAKNAASVLKNMGEGERVKKIQIIDLETEKVVLHSHEIPY